MAGIADVMRCRSVIGSDYATFMDALRGRRCSCAVGVGYASISDGLDRCTLAVERMLESPFLGGMKRLKNSDAVLFTLSGGTDLQIAEMKRSLEIVSGMLPVEANVILGVNTCEALTGRIQMTAVSVKYDQNPAKTVSDSSRKRKTWEAPAAVSRTAQRNGRGSRDFSGTRGKHAGNDDLFEGTLKQGELGLMSLSRGIFEKTPLTKYQNEDLDVPTFQRKNITIDAGN